MKELIRKSLNELAGIMPQINAIQLEEIYETYCRIEKSLINKCEWLMKVYFLVLLFSLFISNGYSQLRINCTLDSEMSYLVAIENTSQEELSTFSFFTVDSTQIKRDGEFLKVYCGYFDRIDFTTFIKLRTENKPSFSINEKKQWVEIYVL